MAKYRGCDGVVKTGEPSAKVVELVGFSIDENAEVLEATILNDNGNRRVKSGVKSWSGTIDTYYDPEDAGIINLVAGDIVDLELYPSGEEIDLGNFSLIGEALIATASTPVTTEGSITQSFTFEGNGALIKTELET